MTTHERRRTRFPPTANASRLATAGGTGRITVSLPRRRARTVLGAESVRLTVSARATEDAFEAFARLREAGYAIRRAVLRTADTARRLDSDGSDLVVSPAGGRTRATLAPRETGSSVPTSRDRSRPATRCTSPVANPTSRRSSSPTRERPSPRGYDDRRHAHEPGPPRRRNPLVSTGTSELVLDAVVRILGFVVLSGPSAPAWRSSTDGTVATASRTASQFCQGSSRSPCG
ncbi:hypothetical protein ACFQMM_24290 [Saliphagus sp. GCM10025308]